jgi:hypothetical protein
MKPKLILCLALVFTGTLFASLVDVPYRGYGVMADRTDLAVVGTVVKVQDLDETNSMMFHGAEVKLRGVETTFKVSRAFKGQLTTNIVVLHHYRLDQEHSKDTPKVIFFTPERFNQMAVHEGSFSMPRGLIQFTPNPTNKFELFLIKDGNNRFAPASGQISPSYSLGLEPPPYDISYLHDADRSIREAYQISLPTKLLVKQIKGVLRIHTDKQSLEVTNISIGTNMNVGIWCDIYVHDSGASRPTNYCHSLQPDIGVLTPDASEENKLEFDPFTYYWRPDGNGIAQPAWSSQPWIHSHEGSVVAGKNYTIEMDLTLFETDSNGRIDRYWNPQSARYYKILWQRTLKTVAE